MQAVVPTSPDHEQETKTHLDVETPVMRIADRGINGMVCDKSGLTAVSVRDGERALWEL